jgi:phosphatidylserine/phosphatidylglycerophosphate/cardiolipin synthase-like enzyme
MKAFTGLSRPSLLALAKALQGGRLSAPYSSSEVGRYIAERERATIAEVLQRLDDGAMRPEQIAMVLELLADERLRAQVMADRLDLVWSGPNGSRGQTRATATVVRELFAAARRSVLVASYALDRGEPELEVRLFVNVARPYGDETPESVLLREFADAFRDELWPGDRLPIVFHDPRALALGFDERACLHAKCVVIDDERALVTSANFTEAAQARNIEVGVLVDEPGVAAGLRRQFEALVAAGVLVRVAGLEERR